MEATSNDSENLGTAKNEHNEGGKKQRDGRKSRVSGSRRTRSQAAPEWTTMASLILVNEIAAVEGDCSKALSSYQKWKIIADNCTALDVVRSLNQCRRKWESLLVEYNMIEQWELQSSDSYWSLEIERREELGLPEDFDNELFEAIANLVREQEDQLDTESDVDPEAEGETVNVITESGSKKQRRRLKAQKCRSEEKEKRTVVEEEESCEDKEGMMAEKLREQAELILAILKGKLPDEDIDCKLSDLKNSTAAQIDVARRQGNKLIACFKDVVNMLDQLRDLVQECK